MISNETEILLKNKLALWSKFAMTEIQGIIGIKASGEEQKPAICGARLKETGNGACACNNRTGG